MFHESRTQRRQREWKGAQRAVLSGLWAAARAAVCMARHGTAWHGRFSGPTLGRMRNKLARVQCGSLRYLYLRPHLYPYLYLYLHLCLYTYTYIPIYLHLYLYTYIPIYQYTNIPIYQYTNIPIYQYTNIPIPIPIPIPIRREACAGCEGVVPRPAAPRRKSEQTSSYKRNRTSSDRSRKSEQTSS